jgi:hypothetical protein
MARERKQTGYEERFLSLVGDDFPNGLEPIAMRELSGRPADGVFVLEASQQAEQVGIATGDIIVALDGFRVRTRRQYVLVRKFSDRPEMALVVYRHPGYLEVKARSADRRLGFDMRSHRTGVAANEG